MPTSIGNYVASLRRQPLRFQRLAPQALPGARLHRYRLESQSWPAGAAAHGWQHQLDIIQPAHPRPGPALLLANNHSAFPDPDSAEPLSAAVDFDADSLLALALDDGTPVISLAQLPNQPLRLPGTTEALREDELVAASWRAFMASHPADPNLPLQVPMTAAVMRAIDLWQQLSGASAGVIVAGLSKRAATAWLAALNEPRVVALAALGLDIHFQAVLDHIERVYQGQWPVALTAYVKAGITSDFRSRAFAQLMDVIDPWALTRSSQGRRLDLPKLVVHASGDDFFPPDCPGLYASDLPPPLGLLTLANCDHAGIRHHVASSLIPYVRRIRHGRALPQLPQLPQGINDARAPSMAPARRPSGPADEQPVQCTWWQAHNPAARDFRYAQGIRYYSQDWALHRGDRPGPCWPPAGAGWHAGYLACRYADGLQLSSPVQVCHQP